MRVYLLFLLVALSACERSSSAPKKTISSTQTLTPTAPSLPVGEIVSFNQAIPPSYRVNAYLQLAIELQQMDRVARTNRLREMCDNSATASQIYVLCRMLFEADGPEEFRPPGIGNPSFADSPQGNSATKAQNPWPLDPIALHQGIPILVVLGYYSTGLPESPLSYLEYCQNSCKERPERFRPRSNDEILAVLQDFLESHPRFAAQRQFILNQADR